MDVITREIRALRAREGLTQNDMAGKLKVTPQTYQKWESEPRTIPIEKLNCIFGIFNTTFEEIFFKSKFFAPKKLIKHQINTERR